MAVLIQKSGVSVTDNYYETYYFNKLYFYVCIHVSQTPLNIKRIWEYAKQTLWLLFSFVFLFMGDADV